MTKKIIFITSFLFSLILLSQKTEPIYYNKEWKVTTKDKALYYRLMPIKELGEMILMQDFYINGTPQFEGYAFKSDENKYVGDIVWYDENGNDTTFKMYPNNTDQSILTYYYPNGKVRKMVQYKKGWKGTETIFHEDGTVLMKGFFEEGKPAKGEFANVNNRDRYEVEVRDKERTTTYSPPQSLPPPSAMETEIVENSPEAKANEKKATVTEKIFWANSKQIAQEKIYRIELYDYKLIQQKNYDKTGKLLQTLNEKNFEKYSSRIIDGSEYGYYLQNNFANGLKSVSVFTNGDKSGKETAYFPNGKIAFETNFKNGLKEGEKIVFNENGTLKSKRTYLGNKPFNGNFDEQINDAFVSLNYVNGLKDGEAIAKNENGDVIAQGMYKKGKPFNGAFIEGEQRISGEFELINVENFRQTGLQKVFSYSLYNLEKTYTIQNGKLNGLTTFYKDDKVFGTLEYKNDEPYNGTLVKGKTKTIYKNGKMVSETILKNNYDSSIKDQKLYNNGELVKIISGSFFIPDVPQNNYEGILKNGKPFSGYFETEENQEFKQVDYYENGEKKFQYSNDYMKDLDSYKHQYYDIKSTYKNGRIFDGVEYVLREKQFVSRYWKNGILQSFNWDVFAMHYFNRIHFELKGNTIELKEMQEQITANIVINPDEKNFSKKLMMDGKVIQSKVYSDTKTKSPSITLYSLKNDKLTSESVETLDFKEEPPKNSELIFNVYLTINPKMGNVQQIFNTISENIGTESWIGEVEGKSILTGIQLDANGKPQDGILITENKDKTYILQLYTDGKLLKLVEKVSFNKLNDEVQKLDKVR